jgi:hypothetical protein
MMVAGETMLTQVARAIFPHPTRADRAVRRAVRKAAEPFAPHGERDGNPGGVVFLFV